VEEVIEDFRFEMSGLHTQVALNILPLGSYDVFLSMEWLVVHKKKLNYFDKTFECEDVEGNTRVFQSIHKLVSSWKISKLYLKKFNRKGCPLYSIQVFNSIWRKDLRVEDHPVL
jgi:hypothetical protein